MQWTLISPNFSNNQFIVSILALATNLTKTSHMFFIINLHLFLFLLHFLLLQFHKKIVVWQTGCITLQLVILIIVIVFRSAVFRPLFDYGWKWWRRTWTRDRNQRIACFCTVGALSRCQAAVSDTSKWSHVAFYCREDDGDEQGLSTDRTSSLLAFDSFDFLFSVAALLIREIKSFETPLQSEITSSPYCLEGSGGAN